MRLAVWLGLTLPGVEAAYLASASAQQGTAVLVGRVQDAESGKPIGDAVVTLTSPNLQGEELAVTDATGAYRIPDLPPGTYVLRVEVASFRPYAREGIELHADTTIRLNASVLPEALKAKEVVVVGRTPSVDVGSSSTGMNITSDFTARIPLSAPGAKGSASRSFESVADVVPGAQFDSFGVSMFGSTSPENRYLLDGMSVSNPTFGVLGTPLSIEFIKEISVLSGGYMPEYGRATGGILNAITKSGTNEYHGSVFLNFAPGALEGHRREVTREQGTIVTSPKLGHMGDIGGDVGGPIIKDKLWFYAGFDYAQTRYKLRRSLYRTLLDDTTGEALTNDDGSAQTEYIPGSRRTYIAQQDMYQGIGKLTWAVDKKNRINVSVNGAYPVTGGGGQYGINPLTGLPEIGTESTSYTTPLNGPYSAMAHRYPGNSTNVLAKWSSELDGKKALLDTWLGWHGETGGRLPADGSAIGSANGMAGQSNVWWLRNSPPHNLSDFERIPGGACDSSLGNPCPVYDYHTGGPEYLSKMNLNRVQGRSVFTYLFQGLGHHVFKAGVDLEHVTFNHTKAYSGARDYVESDDGSYFYDGRVYGYLTAPDETVVMNKIVNNSRSLSVGGFLQDSWNIMDEVTLNVGARYDAQLLYAGNGELAMTLPNQWSPRAGLIWDPTHEGLSKVFVNYARYYETVPLVMLDRYLTGEPFLYTYRDPGVCNPLEPGATSGSCLAPEGVIPIGSPPNTNNVVAGAGVTPIDPKLKAPSTDEFVAGGEYEILKNGRLGVSYTKRWLNRTIEDMSRDEAQTFFFGNPGYGIASDFPKARRLYDGLTFYFTKMYAQGWLAQVSYTASWLRGNYGGLYRAEDLQFDPHQNSDFDLRSLITNRNGYLPGDHRHFIKGFGSKDFDFGDAGVLTPGLGFRAYSGAPTSALGAHPLYGPDQVYILQRGTEERLPWNVSGDIRLSYGIKTGKGTALAVTVDVFNVFNFQGITGRDQRYTSSAVLPVTSGNLSDLKNADGSDFDTATVNPNYRRATSYQAPRVFRFGVKGTF